MENQKTNKAKFLLTIAGPTAVGKTDLTVEIAKRYNASVFSADSRQLYLEMNIGTAKPDADQLRAVQHYFINHLSVNQEYSAGKYEREFDAAISEYFKSSNFALLSGGTGLYIQAALDGLDQFPTVSEEVKSSLDSLFKSKGLDHLVDLLKEKDPAYAKTVDTNNSRRIIRALAVIQQSGKLFSSFLSQKKKRLPYTSLKICLIRDRQELYERINTRVDIMMEKGLLDEVRGLLPFRNQKALQTVGYTELFEHLNGAINIDDAIELIKRNSRRYAKRQMTWFKNQGDWEYFHADDHESIYRWLAEKLSQSEGN